MENHSIIEGSFKRSRNNGWQAELAQAISDPQQLLALLDLSASPLADKAIQTKAFRLRVPRSYVARMRKGDPDDPLLKQVLPVDDENRLTPGYSSDPLGELEALPSAGVLHKYHGRALLVATGACGIHCRYCFRRYFPYARANPAINQWQGALDYLRSQTSVTEVILSGGDPLSLTDNKLANLASALADIPHLKRLRVHTRLPVVLPSRITGELIAWLTDSRLTPCVVMHFNHPNEIDHSVAAALSQLREAGVTVLNQAVLIKGVNDSSITLRALSEDLFTLGILPYYLHLLDPVQGTAHFSVSRERAIQLIATMRSTLPGYLVPRLVWEKAGANAKLPVEHHGASEC